MDGTKKLFWGLVSAALVVYGLSLPAVMTGRGDSDELIADAYIGSLPHPPGYPLLIALTHVWLQLVPRVWVNLAANGLNAVLTALTVGVVFLTIVEVIGSNKRALLSAVVATMALTTAYLWWLWAPVFEAFALLHLGASLLIYFTIRLVKARSKRNKELFGLILGGLVSLAVFHQQLVLLWLPFMGWCWWKAKPNNWRLLMVVMGVGLLIVGGSHLVLSRVLAQAPSAWNVQPGVEGWWQFLSRNDYSGFNVENGAVTAAVFGNIDIRTSLLSIEHYLTRVLPESWLWWILPMIYGGWLLWFDKRWRSYRWVVYLGLISTVGAAAYFTIPSVGAKDYWITRALTERIFLMGFMPLAVWLGVGIANIMDTFTPKRHIHVYVLVALMIVGLVGEIVVNNGAKQVVQSRSLYTRMQQSLAVVPPNSRIICFSDISCFGLRWLQMVRALRPDVAVIAATPQMDYRLFLQQTNLRTVPYPDNPFMVSDVVGTALEAGVPIYSAEMPTYYQNLWQVNTGGLQINQAGLLEQITCLPKPIATKVIAVGASESYRTSNRDSYSQVIALYLAQQPPGSDSLRPACSKRGERIHKSKECIKKHLVQCALSQAWLGMMEAPSDVAARLNLADTLEKTGNLELAKREYRHVLELTHMNASASAGLVRLETVTNLP